MRKLAVAGLVLSVMAAVLVVGRVVGVPGDTVRAVEDSVGLNGSPLRRELLRDEGGVTILRETIGDNRYHAVDSRYFGHIKFATMVGKRP